MKEEIDKMTRNKGKRYVAFENYEKRKKISETMIAEKNEIEEQLNEYSNRKKIWWNDLRMAIQSNQARIITSKSGIHLIGLEIIKELYRLNNSLPIYARRSLIVDIVERRQFVALKGETGSGKSTQLPQYVMENLSRAPNMKVICTQPRKVAAISLARRIAQEQFQQVGDQIGYWVGMNKCFSEKTKLLLMTDRDLLNHCLENPQLEGVSCVIIDEAHERSINIDLILGMVKAAAKAREDLKVIVTSATISTKLFSEYFYGCQVIEIPGRIYPVELMYEEKEPGVDHVKKAVSKALQVHRNEGPGDILVFLTTPLEVDGAVDAFAKALSKTDECTVLPLHGKLQPEDQMRVFEKTPNEARKVIFATNVAETSVTIQDFLYGKYKYILGNASFFLLPYHIDQVCILGDMLKVPMITLNYEPGILCKNVFSLKPDPVFMNQAVITMIREDRPRVVAVIIEGTQKCKAVVVLKQEFFCKSYIYEAIAEDISEIVTMTENSTNKVTVDHGKKKGATIITLSGENTFTYIEVYNLLRGLVEGEVVHNINISQSTYNLMMKKIQNLEKEKQLGKIEFDKRNGQIRIYGNAKNRKLLEDELKEMHEKMCSNETMQIDLKGKGKRPGLMKELMRKYGPRLHGMMPSEDCGVIEMNIRQQMVSVSASVDVQKRILNLVNECNKELEEGNIMVHQENDDELDMCPLCLCPAEVPIYILQSCGHAYCSECLNQYIESCISDKKFPITCCAENCSRNLVIKDLDMLIQFKAKRADLVQASVGHFVMQNSKLYKYCPTPDCCMVYRITDEQNPKAFHCPNCAKSTCTGCHQNTHDAFQSCKAWKSYNDDDHMLKWAREHDARKCPQCNWMIEKNKGCMHMHCKCGAHICWGCMKVFKTSTQCYDHQSDCTREPPL